MDWPIVIPFKTDPTDLVDELTSNVVRDMLADIDATEVRGWPTGGVEFNGILMDSGQHDLAGVHNAVGGEAIAGGITREMFHDAMRIMRENGARG